MKRDRPRRPPPPRERIVIASRRVLPSICPACRREQDGLTNLSTRDPERGFDERNDVPGACGSCGTPLVFEWKKDRYWPRLMEQAEYSRLPKMIRAVISQMSILCRHRRPKA